MSKFKDLSLLEPLLQNLDRLGHQLPTAIQSQVIPLILQNEDLVAIAQTGTGKTAAFCLPMIQKLISQEGAKGLRALILAPTRELATQIQLSFESYSKNIGLKSLAIYGGVGQKQQVESLRSGVDVLIATPGRLLDLMTQNEIRLSKVEMVVLDEADRMLDMGFIDDVQTIFQSLPIKRQTLFFSATMPDALGNLARKILYRPKRIEASANSSTVIGVKQKVIFCKREDKFQILRKILTSEKRELVIIFTKTKNSADKIREYFRFHRIPATVYHGDKSQDDRERALSNFKNGSFKILVCTDLAARGIDIEGVSHVINFELPLEPESYVHRIGRTARAGKEGIAISLCEDAEKPMLERIQKLIQLNLESETFKGAPEAYGIWTQPGSIRTVKAPTPGKSQEKSAYIDHSKRQRVVEEGAPKPKMHPGFRKKKKKR